MRTKPAHFITSARKPNSESKADALAVLCSPPCTPPAPPTPQQPHHSHSMVEGGLDVMSYTTRFTPCARHPLCRVSIAAAAAHVHDTNACRIVRQSSLARIQMDAKRVGT
jgi:hypothetical protein